MILLYSLPADNPYYGVFYSYNWELLGINLFAIIIVTIWVTFSSVIMFFLIDITIGLRVLPQDELVGLDHKYGGMAYNNEDNVHIFSASSSENTLAKQAYKTVQFVQQQKKYSNTTTELSEQLDSQHSVGSFNSKPHRPYQHQQQQQQWR